MTGSHPEWFEATKLISWFDEGQFSKTLQTGETSSIPYRLFRPNADGENRQYPLVVWLHGYGVDEKNLPNVGQLKHLQLVFRDLDHREKYQFYLLAPQNVSGTSWYENHLSEQAPNEEVAMGDLTLDLIEEVIGKYPIDPDRVTLVGISSGIPLLGSLQLDAPIYLPPLCRSVRQVRI